ncbi:uncharacterized protein BYT42DRAFT_577084 [Radiomyces spectabilis]|uniref:uncharacterized protein n=1 Tax=Radiomyces spectabilis TaxID=64574 RepID=UPI00221F4CD3|nr:uncharacterized protein BYT42DRAFT_577084 [Radiomyces spectabilis]KAI8374637.1 hypothetical protein BYT42DRAFT_577084 [Radiomyces spectabilis]
MANSNVAEIKLREPSVSYFPGETVAGSVKLKLSKSVSVGDIQLVWSGKVIGSVQGRAPQTTYLFNTTYHVLPKALNKWKSKQGDSMMFSTVDHPHPLNQTLSKGCHNLYFNLQVPLDLPSSTEPFPAFPSDISVIYTVEAVVLAAAQPTERLCNTSCEIPIVERVLVSSVPLGPREALCQWSSADNAYMDSVCFKAVLQNSECERGKPLFLKVMMLCQNPDQWQGTVAGQISLLRIIEIHTSEGWRTLPVDVVKEDPVRWGSDYDNAVCDMEFDLPRHITPTMNRCDMLRVNYQLRLHLSVKTEASGVIQGDNINFPIVVGTVSSPADDRSSDQQSIVSNGQPKEEGKKRRLISNWMRGLQKPAKGSIKAPKQDSNLPSLFSRMSMSQKGGVGGGSSPYSRSSTPAASGLLTLQATSSSIISAPSHYDSQRRLSQQSAQHSSRTIHDNDSPYSPPLSRNSSRQTSLSHTVAINGSTMESVVAPSTFTSARRTTSSSTSRTPSRTIARESLDGNDSDSDSSADVSYFNIFGDSDDDEVPTTTSTSVTATVPSAPSSEKEDATSIATDPYTTGEHGSLSPKERPRSIHAPGLPNGPDHNNAASASKTDTSMMSQKPDLAQDDDIDFKPESVLPSTVGANARVRVHKPNEYISDESDSDDDSPIFRIMKYQERQHRIYNP